MSIIRSEARLLPEYVPEKIPHREHEFQSVTNEFSGLCSSGTAGQVVLITGRIGVGKTMLAKKASRYIKNCARLNALKVIDSYVNARLARTPLAIANWIITGLGGNFPRRGFDFTEALMHITGVLSSSGSKMLLILDEVDYPVLIENNMALSELLYSIMRIGETMEMPFSLIVISKGLGYLGKLDPSTRSYMERIVLKLRPYTEEQLFDILKTRSEEALVAGAVDDEPLRLIASIASRYGDARLALEILYRACKLAEYESSRRILASHVREAVGSLPISASMPDLAQLNMDEKTVLLAVVRALRSTGSAMVSMGEIRYHYEALVSSGGDKPMSYTKFWMIMKSLATKGLVALSPSGKRVRGRTTLVGIPAGQLDILESVISSHEGVAYI